MKDAIYASKVVIGFRLLLEVAANLAQPDAVSPVIGRRKVR